MKPLSKEGMAHGVTVLFTTVQHRLFPVSSCLCLTIRYLVNIISRGDTPGRVHIAGRGLSKLPVSAACHTTRLPINARTIATAAAGTSHFLVSKPSDLLLHCQKCAILQLFYAKRLHSQMGVQNAHGN